MVLAEAASTQVAWIGALALILSALIAAIATYWASRSRDTLRGTTDSLTDTAARVLTMEDIFEDMRAERNRARLLAEHETKRADAAEQRADRAQKRADDMEVRVHLLEVQAELYRLQHPDEAE